MKTVALSSVGRLDLTNLIGMCSDHGDGVPYPLWRTQRQPYWGEVEKDLLPFHDRFVDDLSVFAPWVDSYARADIWVDCRVNAFNASTPEGRILAHRAGEEGYLASQRADADVIDVYRLSALDLGAAVAGMAGLTQPGSRKSIIIPGLLDEFVDEVTDVNGAAAPNFADDDDYTFSLRESAHAQPDSTTVNEDRVTLLGTAQSRCRPKDVWDVDWTRDVVVWVQIDGDGDYVFTPDRGQAVPVTPRTLRQRIDGLIAADVAVLRRERGLT